MGSRWIWLAQRSNRIRNAALWVLARWDKKQLPGRPAINGGGMGGTAPRKGRWKSVERRVDALEMPETCVLWWTTNLVSGGRVWIPTNFPTRRLEIRAERTGISDCYSYLDATWNPGRNVEIDYYSFASTAGTNIFSLRRGSNTGSTNIVPVTFNSTPSRLVRASYDPVAEEWRLSWWTIDAGEATIRYAMGAQERHTPTGPSTVEEWLERYQGATE